MPKCKICKKEIKTTCALSRHINQEHNISKEEYYLKYIGNKTYCLECGKETKFKNINEGYRDFCSSQCSNKSPLTQQKKNEATIKNYGVKNPFQSEEIKDKSKQTHLEKYGVEFNSQMKSVKEKKKKKSLEKYGVENVSQSEEIKDKKKQKAQEIYGVDYVLQSKEIRNKGKKTNLEKFGVEYPSQSKEIKQESVSTSLERYGETNVMKLIEIKDKQRKSLLNNYGVDSPLRSEEIKEKVRNTNLEKYGVDNPAKLDEIKEKVKQTNLEKFGVKYPLQSEEKRKQAEETCIVNYGVRYSMQSKDVREKSKKTLIKKYNVDNAMKSEEIIEKARNSRHNSYIDYLLTSDRLKDKVEILFTSDVYNGTSYSNKYPFKCKKCNTEFDDHLYSGHIPRCPVCYPPTPTGTSIFEKEVVCFCKKYFSNLIENDRNVLEGKELDIYIPSINLAIECNGLYWHSELNGKDKNYHLNKTLQCQEKGIRLIHIFEDEWYNTRDVVESILLSKMGKITNRIFARKCDVRIVESEESNIFLFENHLQGEINGKSIGLYYNDKLVSILTYGKPRFNNNYDIEIYRFCNKKNTNVVGSLSRLISKLSGKIISYCDLRYGTGNGYINAGMQLLTNSDSNYWYIKGNDRYNRMKFQKHKLENVDNNLTEWQNMQLDGFDRIWDCGNSVYVKE